MDALEPNNKNRKKRQRPQHGAFSNSWQQNRPTQANRQNVHLPKPPQQRPQRGGVPPQDAFENLPRRRPPNVSKEEWRRILQAEYEQQALQRQQMAQQQSWQKQQAAQRQVEQVQPSSEPSSDEEQPPVKGNKKPKKPRKPVTPARRRRNRRIAATLAILTLISIGAYLSFTFFFKIETFALEGEVPYELDDIVAVFGHQKGENMFAFSATETKQEIEKALPYIENVTVIRRLPNQVAFRVEPAKEQYCVEQNEQFAILSEKRKVLRITDEQPEGMVRLIGLSDLVLEPGLVMEPPEGADSSGQQSEASSASTSSSGEETLEDSMNDELARYTAMELMLNAIDQSGLSDVNWIDVSDPINLQFRWQDRITVKLGTRAGIDEKMAAVISILTDPEESQFSDTDKGTLDASSYISTLRVWFAAD